MDHAAGERRRERQPFGFNCRRDAGGVELALHRCDDAGDEFLRLSSAHELSIPGSSKVTLSSAARA